LSAFWAKATASSPPFTTSFLAQCSATLARLPSANGLRNGLMMRGATPVLWAPTKAAHESYPFSDRASRSSRSVASYSSPPTMSETGEASSFIRSYTYPLTTW
jgi:hypothetical protein